MALPKDMRLKGHRTFDYVHKNSIKYHGKLMTFKVARSNPEILLSHKLTNSSNKFRVAIAISKKFSKKDGYQWSWPLKSKTTQSSFDKPNGNFGSAIA